MGPRDFNGYIKGITVIDKRQKKFSILADKLDFHYQSVYKVPFDSDRNLDMLWHYEVVKLSLDQPHKFVVQVVSWPRKEDELMQIRFYTNADSHFVHINQSQPLKFFVEVKLNNIPVIDARVMLKIKVTNHDSAIEKELQVQLLDNGNGDPDVKASDGVYSRYFTQFEAGDGRYDIEVYVDNEPGSAYTYQPLFSKDSNNLSIARNVKLNSFSRIVKGHSLRIMSLEPSKNYAPARILDLSASVLLEQQQVQLTWTAPGEILDQGRVFSYKIFVSDLSTSFYKRDRALLTQIAATKSAGVLEQFSINFKDFDQDSYLAIAAINKYNKMAELSNVVHVKLPSSYLNHDQPQHHKSQDVIKTPFDPNLSKKSDKVLFYVLFSIIGVLLLSILAIVLIMKRFKVSKADNFSSSSSQEDPMDHFDIIDVTDEEAMVNNGTEMKSELTLPTFYKSNISILKNNEDSLCNCHEVNNDQDLVINPYINYSSLNSTHQHRSTPPTLNIRHIRQEPIYANQQEIFQQHYPIYSVVNKRSKNVTIVVDDDVNDNDDKDTETDRGTTEDEEENERCLTPSNTFLEVSYDDTAANATLNTPKLFSKELMISSTPNVANTSATAKVRTITQV